LASKIQGLLYEILYVKTGIDFKAIQNTIVMMIKMKAKIISYPCKGWCVGFTGDAQRYNLPELGYLVTFEGKCPHKGRVVPGVTSCFFEDKLAKIEILDD
jgi:hypothetical protein